ncbi:maleylpyruvate isomerase family mycothiol-dependent enzyme [Nocardia salmonicida]|uniref:maleylpyruvate isomerase family mycothiol-dependent enzyme n=1 Tax=Nocardia salmonicida TaxID=53431 RepID=UPI00342D167F
MRSIDQVVAHVASAHERERALIQGIDEDSARAPSLLPGWTRGHVLSCRLAFLRAARRQVDNALAGSSSDFYDGGKPGREAEIDKHANSQADWLVAAVQREIHGLDQAWAEMSEADWLRPANYREPCTLASVLHGSWRETEIHCVDYGLGVDVASWSPEFCAHLFDFLTPRVPENLQLEFQAPGEGIWRIGDGDRVTLTGSLPDLAGWLAGREPAGFIESSTGSLPSLQRLRRPRRSPATG